MTDTEHTLNDAMHQAPSLIRELQIEAALESSHRGNLCGLAADEIRRLHHTIRQAVVVMEARSPPDGARYEWNYVLGVLRKAAPARADDTTGEH